MFLKHYILIICLTFSFVGCESKDTSVEVTPSNDSSYNSQDEIPLSVVIPVSSVGEVQEVRKQILQNTFEDELKYQFRIVPKQKYEQVLEKVFEELEYEECTEDQCIMRIQEILQVENVFHLQILGEGENTQLSMSWRTLDEKFVEEEYCQKCDTNKLRTELRVLVQKVLGTNMRVRHKEKELEQGNLYWVKFNDEWVWSRNIIGKVKYYYYGYIKNNLPHQLGEIQYLTRNTRYKGSFKEGKFHGLGFYISSKGERYDGIWEMGKLNKSLIQPED